MRARRALALVLALPFVSGCPSYLVAQSPRTVLPGHVETSATASDLVHAGGTVAGTAIPTATDLPDVSASMRIGLTSFADLGLHLHASDLGVGLDLKIRFVNTPHLEVAAAPGIETSLIWPLASALSELVPKNQAVLKGFVYTLHLPLLFGIPIRNGPLVFFGPKLILTNWQASVFLPQSSQSIGVGTLAWQPGVVLGAEIPMRHGLRILPELDVHYDVNTNMVFLAFGVTGIYGF